MARKKKPDHSLRMMSDVVHKRTSVALPSEEASHRPLSEGPLVPPPFDHPSQRPPLVAPPLEEASQRPPLEGPLVPPHRPLSLAPQQLSFTQPPGLSPVCPPLVAPQQLSSQLESSSPQPTADPSISSQPTSVLHQPQLGVVEDVPRALWSKDNLNVCPEEY
ncbi:vegetative cell wall protein gp1-like isoform X2 [Camellia sinensis]|uniref:vegetative cell wall protein gp1-like isoform X2 n=1 Tax=Camellia sinensis TaxID=4442 RepID=UPI0010358516|nr:vegetative cell wall protein gp1-like isoform X2 [Camellia sinensis]